MLDHDPGGKVRIVVPAEVHSEAIYSPCRQYRYLLQRRWEQQPDRSLLFIMMNLSTATEDVDDPTVRKCRHYAMRWGYNHLIVGNVMAYRATNPRLLCDIADPVGPDNLGHLRQAILAYVPLIVCAWGRLPRRLPGPEHSMLQLLYDLKSQLHVLRLNSSGGPWHPLYLPMKSTPILWKL